MEAPERMVSPEELSEFPGTFTSSQVDAAADQVREECGWHIAPRITETLLVDSYGGHVLLLPTMQVVDVSEVRDVTGDTPRVINHWRKSRIGTLTLPRGWVWPEGSEAVEVDVTHGYERCPDALLPIVAERCQVFAKDGSVRQESLGSRSVAYGFLEGGSSASVLARFKLGNHP